MAQPDSPNDVIAQRLKNPKQKAILVMWGSSLSARYASNQRNHSAYDLISTYKDRLVDNKAVSFPTSSSEQDILNYVLNQKAAIDGLRVERRQIMCWPDHSMHGLDSETVSKRAAAPRVPLGGCQKGKTTGHDRSRPSRAFEEI